MITKKTLDKFLTRKKLRDVVKNLGYRVVHGYEVRKLKRKNKNEKTK